MVGGRHGTRLVVVVEEVVLPVVGPVVGGTFAAVAGISLPVVHHVVEDGHGALLGGHVVVVDAGVAAVVMRQEVVVVGGVVAAPDAAITVGALVVDGVAEAFRNDVPLEGEILHPVEGSALVGAPAHGAMVDDDLLVFVVVVAHHLHGVVFRLFLIAHPAADETDDHVAGADAEGVVLQADTVTGGALAGDGQVSPRDVQLLLQGDGAGHVEDDGQRPIRFFDAVPEGALRAVVLQGGHVVDFAATAAGGVHAAALGAGEGAGDAVLFHRGNGELLIVLAGRRGGRFGVHRSIRAGVDPGHGRSAARVHGLDAELVIRRLGQAGDRRVAGADTPLIDFGAVFLEFPGVGSRALHRIPLELQAGFRLLVQLHVRGGGRGLGGVGSDDRILLLTAAGGQKQGSEGHQGQFFSHSFSYSREAQMKGPTPFGSFSMIFSLM